MSIFRIKTKRASAEKISFSLSFGYGFPPYSGVRVRIPYPYRTPYLSTGTEGVRYTGKSIFLGTEMVRSTEIILKMKYGTGTGKIGGKIMVRSTVRIRVVFEKQSTGKERPRNI